MDVKAFEIRDRMTFIPVVAVRLNPADMTERYLIGRAGFGAEPDEQKSFVFMIHPERQLAHYDPHSWKRTTPGSRTMETAHEHIRRNWDELPTGAVIDVEFILGETTAPKPSESQGWSADDILAREA